MSHIKRNSIFTEVREVERFLNTRPLYKPLLNKITWASWLLYAMCLCRNNMVEHKNMPWWEQKKRRFLGVHGLSLKSQHCNLLILMWVWKKTVAQFYTNFKYINYSPLSVSVEYFSESNMPEVHYNLFNRLRGPHLGFSVSVKSSFRSAESSLKISWRWL